MARLDVSESAGNKHLENRGGAGVLHRLGGRDQGLPYFAFLDAKGELVVNSRREGQGNIGYPAQPEEVAWFLIMVRRAAPEMSDAEARTLEDTLRNLNPKR